MNTLSYDQNVEIFKSLLSTSKVENKKLITNLKDFRSSLLKFNFLSSEIISVLTSKQLSINIIKGITGVDNINSLDVFDSLNNLKFTNEYYNSYDNGKYQSYVRFNWYSIEFGYWNLEMNNELSKLFSSASSGSEWAKEMIAAILESVTDIPVVGEIILAAIGIIISEYEIYSSIFNNGNGMCMDWQTLVIVYCRASDHNWN
ncbi:hypothetical protein [Spiroplasma endosymbiont of Aspidapion aeneum]|uniref:hypothetical protein n=1 Tax=Spiroplasma endosymbiont of Aspidapion aeneum TaxID=3066276 RepID=UPI00313C9C34